MHNHLIYRLVIVNTCGTVAAAYAWQMGIVDLVVKGDQSRICILIAAVFLVALVLSWLEALKVSRRLNQSKAGTLGPFNGEKAMAKIDYLFDFPTSLERLGLFGTVVGILMGMHDIKVNAADIEGTVWQLLGGLATAFLTTAVGLVLAEWVRFNIRPINTALVCLIEDSK